MKTWEWIAATCIAAVMMISYVHGYVYPRTEGEKLESLQQRDIERVEKKIDWIIEFLSAQKR